MGVKLRLQVGIQMHLEVNTGSSAAKSIASRRGTGRVRHLDARELWLQERVARGDLYIKKVAGTDNLADILTMRLGSKDE